MNAIIRKASRGSALLLGSVALTFSLAACGGGGDDAAETTAEETAAEATTEESSEAEAAAEETTESEGEAATEESAEGGEAAGAVTEEDLAAAEETFIGFMTAAGEGDLEGACGYMLDPSTGAAPSEAFTSGCASSMEGNESLSMFTPETIEMIKDQVEATDNGDGTISIMVAGQDAGLPMAKGTDGKWYIDSKTLVEQNG